MGRGAVGSFTYLIVDSRMSIINEIKRGVPI